MESAHSGRKLVQMNNIDQVQTSMHTHGHPNQISLLTGVLILSIIVQTITWCLIADTRIRRTVLTWLWTSQELASGQLQISSGKIPHVKMKLICCFKIVKWEIQTDQNWRVKLANTRLLQKKSVFITVNKTQSVTNLNLFLINTQLLSTANSSKQLLLMKGAQRLIIRQIVDKCTLELAIRSLMKH